MTFEIRHQSVRVISIWLLAVLLMIVLAACSQTGEQSNATGERGGETAPLGATPMVSEGEVVSPGDGDDAAVPEGTDPVDPADEALAYARCIRDNGYPDWPDPNADGQIIMLRGMRDDPRLQPAMDACQDLRPAGTGGGFSAGGAGGFGGLDSEEAMLAFARCMRASGYPDFPDPSTGGRTMINPAPGSGINPNDPKFQAAMQACQASLQGEAE